MAVPFPAHLLLALALAPQGLPERNLAPLPPLDLRAADGPPSPVRPIADYCLLDEHRLAVLRPDHTLLVVTDQGVVSQELHLPQFELPLGPLAIRVERYERIVRTGPDRVLLGPRTHWGDDLAGLLEIDLAARTLRVPALIPRAENGLSLAASPEGGFALLARPDTAPTALYVFEPDGALDWSRTKRICAGRELCFDPDGRVHVLDGGVDALQSFRWNGWWSSYERLEWPSEWTNGLQVLQCAPDGAFWLSGFGSATTRLVCGRPGRTLLRTLDLWHPDGNPVRGELRLSPAGVPWVSDWGSCICRIGRAGEVDLVVGDAPAQHRLDDPSWIAIDRSDHSFALAERDGALHEFDADGKRLRLTPRPPGGDRERSWDEPPRGFEETHRLGFAWEAPLRRWAASGVQREIPRAADVASDGQGNLAFLRRADEQQPGGITLVDATGSELGHWSLPPTDSICCDLDFDGERVVLVLLDQVLAWKRDGTPWFRARLDEPARTRECGMERSRLFRAHLARGGRELWLRRGAWNPVIERYALP